MTSTVELTMPDDMHLHLRQDEVLCAVLPHTTQQFGRALIMPNTMPAILTATDVDQYRREILAASTDPNFEPLMTIQILESTTRAIVREAHAHGAVAGKIYPDGVTTNSEGGVNEFSELWPVFAEMEELGMVLCLHGEVPGRVFCLDREAQFLPILGQVAETFPDLKIVLEHLTTAEAVRTVKSLPGNVAGTITVHHLFLTLDDVVGGLVQPHHFCKPIAKRPDDREALIEAALSGDPKFFLGTDSAPHSVDAKECAGGCAGVFSAPVALPLLVSLLEKHSSLDRLDGFASTFGCMFYGLPPNKRTIVLRRQQWEVPQSIKVKGGIQIVPFMSGETMSWQVA